MTGPSVLLYALGVVIFLGAIFVSIALHELGHLYYAKKFGCRVSQYMVGFGPTVWSWRPARRLTTRTLAGGSQEDGGRTEQSDTEYGIKLIPLGGYVKIIGMFPPETDREKVISRGEAKPSSAAPALEAPLTLRRSNTGLFAQLVSQTRAAEFELVGPGDHDRLFYKLPVTKRILVMLAGPGINIALAFLCFSAVFGLYGTRDTAPTGRAVVAMVSDCVIPETENRVVCRDGDPVAPARAVGLQPGDEIVSFNGQAVTSWNHLSALIHSNGADPMRLKVFRDGKYVQLPQTHTVLMSRDLDGTGRREMVGFLGVEPESQQIITRHGPIFTMMRMGDMTAHAVSSIADLPARVGNVALAVLGQGERSQDGPMSVIGGSRLAGEVAASDAEGLDVGGKAALLVLVVGSFNLFIGVFNLIPLLPLDGGHIAGAAWEGTRRSLARVFRRPDPGFVNVARQLPLAYCLGFALIAMSLVLMIGDIVAPLRSGL